MGLAASQARLVMLTGRKSDLEFSAQQKAQKRMDIADKIQKLYEEEKNCKGTEQKAEMSPELVKFFKQVVEVIKVIIKFFHKDGRSKEEIEKEISALQQEDKKLEIAIKQIDTQHNAVQTEVESVKKVIDKNVEMSFKMFA